jgi:hypothetical protein
MLESDKIKHNPKDDNAPLKSQNLFEAIRIHSNRITGDKRIKKVLKKTPPFKIGKETTINKKNAEIILVKKSLGKVIFLTFLQFFHTFYIDY